MAGGRQTWVRLPGCLEAGSWKPGSPRMYVTGWVHALHCLSRGELWDDVRLKSAWQVSFWKSKLPILVTVFKLVYTTNKET